MDDPFTQQMIADVIAQSDQTDARCAEWEAKRELVQRESNSGTLVHKTYQPRQPMHTTMDAELQRQWDSWCDRRILKMLRDGYKHAVVEFVCTYVGKRLKDETTKLREEIATLRADVAILRGIIQSNNVTPIKSDRDAA